MTFKRLALVFLTIFAAVSLLFSLFESWNQPQFQSRLELYETDLILQASESKEATKLPGSENPIDSALKAYQKAKTSVETAIATATDRLKDGENLATEKQLAQQRSLLNELDLRIGLLQVQKNQVPNARKTWASIADRASTFKPLQKPASGVRDTLNSRPIEPSTQSTVQTTAAILNHLWSDPPKIPTQAEPALKNNLNGWFRYEALAKLYDLQQRSNDLDRLRNTEQAAAKTALTRLASVNALPVVSSIAGIGLLLFVIGQRLIRGKQSLLAGTDEIRWEVPWEGETVWQVMVFGFFFVGQILLGSVLIPVVFEVLKSIGINSALFGVREKAVLSFVSYLLLAIGGLTVLYVSVKRFLPLPSPWFRFSLRGQWLWWGLGGYAAAYPLVSAIGWINNQIWQGRGGSNPILSIVLEGRDPIAFLLFLMTAAIAAPLFEEIFFRGFLLSSLTRYFSTWQSILLSALIFALVHLSLSEVLPLMTLGVILGFVYTRTQNLMASVLLHALWNSGTLVTLYLLGSAGA